MSSGQQTLTAKVKNRLVDQGILFLEAFHREFAKNKKSPQTEFCRGEVSGWRQTLRSGYGTAVANEIVELTRRKTNLSIPHCGDPTDDGYLGLDSGADS
jgi:hypothetical protein